MTKDELLSELQSTRAELDRLLDEMTVDDITRPGAAGDWSVRDMLLHLAWYADEEAGLISEDPNYQASPFWSTPQDERNELLREHFRSHDIAQARAALESSLQRMIDAVDRLTDADLVTRGRFAGMPESRLPWHDIADSTFEHEREHIGIIREWIARRAEAVWPRA